MTLISLRKNGVIGSSIAIVGTAAYGVAFFSGAQSWVLLACAGVGGLGWLSIYWSLGEASKYFGRRIMIDAIVGAIGVSAFVRSSRVLYEPQSSILPTPNYGIFVRLPPSDTVGIEIYFFGIVGSIISGWLIYTGLTALARESGVGLFGTAGKVMLIGAFLSVVFGSMVEDLTVIPLGVGFWRMTKQAPRVESDRVVAAKSRWKFGKEFWFADDGIKEVFTLYEDTFLFALFLGFGFSFVFEFVLALAGYPQYTNLYPHTSEFASYLGSAVGVIVGLGVSRWKLPEFSDALLLNRSKAMIEWEDVKSMYRSSLGRLQIETGDESYAVSMPEDKDALMKLAGSKIGNRLKLESRGR